MHHIVVTKPTFSLLVTRKYCIFFLLKMHCVVLYNIKDDIDNVDEVLLQICKIFIYLHNQINKLFLD